MKRLLLFSGFLVICLSLQAQNFTNLDKMAINGRIDSLIQLYIETSTLSDPTSSDSLTHMEIWSQCKNLFTPDAQIFDEINPEISFDLPEKSEEQTYKLVYRPRDEYFELLLGKFKKGFLITNKRISINYDNFDNGEVEVALERIINATTTGGYGRVGYSFKSTHQVLLKIAILANKSVIFKGLSRIGDEGKFVCLNDKDNDGIVDELDKCKEVKGLKSLNGCPDADGDGIADNDDDCPTIRGPASNGGCPVTTFAYRYVFSGSVGFQFNKLDLEKPDPLTSAYNAEGDIDKSSHANDIINPDLFSGGSLALSANVAYYFGKNKNSRNKGISFGFIATNYSANYSISNSVYKFKEIDGGGTSFKRILTVKSVEEKISFTMINLPLMFRYKGRFGEKWAYEFSAGPSYLSIIASSKSVSDTISFEGVYQHNGSAFYYNPNDQINSSDLVLTASGISQNSMGSATSLFDNLGNVTPIDSYRFGLNQSPKSSGDMLNRSGFAFNAGVDLFYHVGKKFAVKGGVTISVGTLKNNVKNHEYKIIDDKGQYNSFYNSGESSTYQSFGLNFGIILGI